MKALSVGEGHSARLQVAGAQRELAAVNMTEADLATFVRLGITTELLKRAGIERVDGSTAREKYGLKGSGDFAGIIFPYRDPLTGIRHTCRLRRDRPDIEAGKESRKYVAPYGDRRHLYFVTGCAEYVQDATIPVVLVEAEKSALAMTAFAERTGCEILPVAMGGCWGWRGRIGKAENSEGERADEVGPLPDLAVCSNRDVIVMLDSNADTKLQVRAARSALVRELDHIGARVRIASVPLLDGVNGPDDLIALRGDEAVRYVLELARLAGELALAEAEAAIGEIVSARPHVSAAQMRRTLDAVADVADPIQRTMLQSRLAAAARGVIQKNTLVREINERRQKGEDRERDFFRENREADLRTMPIDATRIIEQLEAFFAERAHLPQGAALVLAYFALNTWTFNLFDTSPYLLLESAVPGCGKSTVIRLLEAVSCRSRKATSLSEAVMFRLIGTEAPTLLIDEAETLESRSERAEALRAIAHEGYKKGGQVPRCEGEDHEVRWFDVFCPKVFAAIGGLSGALLDRCIVIHLEKAPRASVRKSTRQRALRGDAMQLVTQLEAYAVQLDEALRHSYEDEPDCGHWPSIGDREAELWGPLLIHARLAGPDAEAKLLAVVRKFSEEKAEIKSADSKVAQAIALLDAISKHPETAFTPGDLVPSLARSEAWGRTLAEVKGRDDNSIRVSQAAKVGYFLRKFRLRGKKNSTGHISYNREDATTCLSAHVPEELQNPPKPPSQIPATSEPAENAASMEGTEAPEALLNSEGNKANLQTSRGQEPDLTEEIFL
jgi:hypothetical protein